MTTTSGSAHYAGLLPIEPSDEPPPVRPATLEDRFLNGQPSLRKRAPRALSRFLIPFCTGVAATSAWWSYGDAVRQVIASWYPQLGWLAPQAGPVTQNAQDMITFVAPATPPFDQQLNAMSLDLTAVRQSTDRIAAGQEQITRSIDQIAPSITTGQSPPTKATGRTGESRSEGASLQPAARLDTTPTEGRPPPTLSETGKQLSAANEHDAPCFPSASALAQNHPGGWPSLDVPSARSRGHHMLVRRRATQRK
jgi:hypothetical protein